jgi:hypothetical protein
MRIIKGYRACMAILLLIAALPCAALGADGAGSGEITMTGIVKKQGITTYMYGQYVLVDANGRVLCALKTARGDLDQYVGRKVTVRGSPVKGYPIDSGPPYIEVQSLPSGR